MLFQALSQCRERGSTESSWHVSGSCCTKIFSYYAHLMLWVFQRWSHIQLSHRGDLILLFICAEKRFFLSELTHCVNKPHPEPVIFRVELKMNPSNCDPTTLTDPLSSVGTAWRSAATNTSLWISSTAQVLPQALPQPVPRCDFPGAVSHLRRSRPGDRLRERRAWWDIQR